MKNKFTSDDFYDSPDYSKSSILASELPEDACLCNITTTGSYNSLFLSISSKLPDYHNLTKGSEVYFWVQDGGIYISFGKQPRLVQFFSSKLQGLPQRNGSYSYRCTLPLRFCKDNAINNTHCFTLIKKAEGVYYADISIQARYTANRPYSPKTENY